MTQLISQTQTSVVIQTRAKFASTQAAAETIGVSKQTVYRYIHTGVLRATMRPGGRDFYINWEDVDKLAALQH